MAGIYFHIPFCKQACHYCDFHFSTSLQYKDDLLNAMLAELLLQKDYLQGEAIETIYFGGGTPSLLSSDEIRVFIDQIAKLFKLISAPEITLEANPDDLDINKVRELRQSLINRFSVGIQSFYDEDLRWMNRVHTSNEAENSIKRVQDAGFENITSDLIYGYPLLSDEKFKSNIRKLLDLSIPHISAYSMTVEPQTALGSFIKNKKQPAMNESQSADQFLLLTEMLIESGFEHYEISNFARREMYSKHNTNYWRGVSYLGIGPSAHSFNGNTRAWNISNNARYIESISRKAIPAELETLTIANKINEYILTSLRTMWGTDLTKLTQDFGASYRIDVESATKRVLEKGLISRENDIITLTLSGKLLADQIAAELFVD